MIAEWLQDDQLAASGSLQSVHLSYNVEASDEFLDKMRELVAQ